MKTSTAPKNFYPRSPCGERPRSLMRLNPIIIFLSTLSLRRATVYAAGRPGYLGNFYPRSPCGERPAHFASQIHSVGISIHALLAESDTPRLARVVPTPIFLSTLSLRRATQGAGPCRQKRGISIHALLAESDSYSQHVTWPSGYFYPRSPCGERPAAPRARLTPVLSISIHALLAESDRH